VQRITLLLFLPLLLSSVNASSAEVVSSIRPLALIVDELLPASISSDSLLSGNVSPHDYSLRMSDAKTLKQASTFIWVGPGMESFLTKAVDRFVSAENEVRLAKLLDRHDEHHHGDHHHSEHHGQGHADHSDNMHLWISHANAAKIASLVVEHMSARQPNLRAELAANLQQFEQRLETERLATQSAFAGGVSKPFFVYHDAYRDYVTEFGLQQKSIAKLVPDTSLSLMRVIGLKRNTTDVVCMLANLDELAEAQALANKIEINLVGVDLLAAQADAKEQTNSYDFFSYMKSVRESFLRCFNTEIIGTKKEEAAIAASSNP